MPSGPGLEAGAVTGFATVRLVPRQRQETAFRARQPDAQPASFDAPWDAGPTQV